jgi:putative endonuclease
MKVADPVAKKGEDLASNYLKKKGYKIIERNFRQGYGEIDIIATHKDTLVFVEVKTRRNKSFGTPLESITPWKLKALVKTAMFYKSINPILPELLRIDALSVVLKKDGMFEIEHVENISY